MRSLPRPPQSFVLLADAILLGEYVCICTRMLKYVMHVWFTVQDALQFVSGGASEERARKNLTTLSPGQGLRCSRGLSPR